MLDIGARVRRSQVLDDLGGASTSYLGDEVVETARAMLFFCPGGPSDWRLGDPELLTWERRIEEDDKLARAQAELRSICSRKMEFYLLWQSAGESSYAVLGMLRSSSFGTRQSDFGRVAHAHFGISPALHEDAWQKYGSIHVVQDGIEHIIRNAGEFSEVLDSALSSPVATLDLRLIGGRTLRLQRSEVGVAILQRTDGEGAWQRAKLSNEEHARDIMIAFWLEGALAPSIEWYPAGPLD
jgi:hypothetical protein